MEFNPKLEANHITSWIQTWFQKNTVNNAPAVIGISGGKDSTVAAALLVQALGPKQVTGVIMPNHTQNDLNDATEVCSILGICPIIVNIGSTVDSIKDQFRSRSFEKQYGLSEDAVINLPPRIRMAYLYAIAQSLSVPGFVCNTCNASEDYIGYSTKYGDAAGDFSPLGGYTVTEIIQIGLTLGIPERLVRKTPSDGLCGMSDEDRFGFTYEVLDNYLTTRICPDPDIKAKIDSMHAANLHKIKTIRIPYCEPLFIKAD